MNFLFMSAIATTAFLLNVTTAIARVTASYSADELGLSVFWVGVIATSFSVLPLPMAFVIGRYIDRGNDAKTAWLGCAGGVVASLVFVIFHSLPGLIAGVALLGMSQMALNAALQILCARDDRPGVLEKTMGNYMVANALGLGVGSLVVGFVGGNVAHPPVQTLFLSALGISIVQLLAGLTLRPSSKTRHHGASAESISLRQLLQAPGFAALLLASVFSAASQDLTFAYMPVIGKIREITVDDVGHLLAALAASSMLARISFSWLYGWFGTWRLTVGSLLAYGAAYICIGLPIPLPLMFCAVVVVGFSSGVALTTTVTGSISLFAPEKRGRANSIRIAAIRTGQITLPSVAGIIATTIGAGSIFVIMGACLMGTGAIVRLHRARRATGQVG